MTASTYHLPTMANTAPIANDQNIGYKDNKQISRSNTAPDQYFREEGNRCIVEHWITPEQARENIDNNDRAIKKMHRKIQEMDLTESNPKNPITHKALINNALDHNTSSEDILTPDMHDTSFDNNGWLSINTLTKIQDALAYIQDFDFNKLKPYIENLIPDTVDSTPVNLLIDALAWTFAPAVAGPTVVLSGNQTALIHLAVANS
ncbi:MAG: hypothetical protein IT497_08080 [Ottowia sp.]|nr:hypothetical protein [Ottowia sp.]